MRNLFWGLLGLMLALLGVNASTGPPTTVIASHDSTLLATTTADGICATANLHTSEGAVTGVFNGASPTVAEPVALFMHSPEGVLMSDPVSHDYCSATAALPGEDAWDTVLQVDKPVV